MDNDYTGAKFILMQFWLPFKLCSNEVLLHSYLWCFYFLIFPFLISEPLHLTGLAHTMTGLLQVVLLLKIFIRTSKLKLSDKLCSPRKTGMWGRKISSNKISHRSFCSLLRPDVLVRYFYVCRGKNFALLLLHTHTVRCIAMPRHYKWVLFCTKENL